MRKNKYFLRISIVVMLLIIIAEVLYYSGYPSKVEPTYRISLIVYGNDPNRWENLKQGAEQAAKDTTAEINLITMSSEMDAKEQIVLIDREIKNGADALMIAACDSHEVEAYVKSVKIDIPLVFVQNGLSTNEEYPFISADNYAMGVELANTIKDNEKSWIKAAVIAEKLNRKSESDRFDGVYNTLSEYADEVVIWERSEDEKDSQAMLFLQRELTEEAVDVVIALDNSSMGALLDAVSNLNKDIKIYGIANSEKAVYYLDNEKIISMIYQNEFQMGYLGVKQILDYDERDKHKPDDVKFVMIDKNNMYLDENQKLLFPFVK